MAAQLTRPRALIVPSGSELARGDRNDRNGPYLAASLVRLGVDVSGIHIVGDGEADLLDAIRAGLQHEILVITGGLGPTHDDRTMALMAEALGVPLTVDESLEREIEEISRAIAARLGRPNADFHDGVRKQATIPSGAEIVGLAGTAPSVVLATPNGIAVVLPGPPAEVHALWPKAIATAVFQRAIGATQAPTRTTYRFFGVSESAVAQALAAAGGEPEGIEVTICAREFEIHVDLLVSDRAAGFVSAFEEAFVGPLRGHLYGIGDAGVEERLLAACRTQGWTLATAESCTGGLVASRLTAIAGSSDAFVGSVVAYANAVKHTQLGVSEAILEAHGAVSAEAAEAMATGVCDALGADVAVSITGIAGPGGGTDEKPVGTVFIHAVTPRGSDSVALGIMGSRDVVRGRAATVALHLLRRLVAEA